jgi:hypothetical protein
MCRAERVEQPLELRPASVPSADVAQVHKKRRGGEVINRPSRGDQRIDLVPLLAFSFRQASQIALARRLLFALTPRAFALLTPSSHLMATLGPRLCPGAQLTHRSQRQRARGTPSVSPKPTQDLGPDATVATSDAREPRHLLVVTDADEPSFEISGQQLEGPLRIACSRCRDEIGIQAEDKPRRESPEPLGCVFRSIVNTHSDST